MKKYFTLMIFTLGFSIICFGQETTVFEHSWWQWVEGADVSDKRMNELAPHFPTPEASNFDLELYDQAFYRWQKLYSHEYEALLNSEELIALNPYYTEYLDVIQLPYYIKPLESYDKPKRPEGDLNYQEEVDYELSLQAWYFVFKPAEFYKIYKIKPEFPEWFDADDYRAKIIKKIEDNK